MKIKLQKIEMKKPSNYKLINIHNSEIINQNAEHKIGKFTFWNGDIYEGEYKVNYDRFQLIKQGNVRKILFII